LAVLQDEAGNFLRGDAGIASTVLDPVCGVGLYVLQLEDAGLAVRGNDCNDMRAGEVFVFGVAEVKFVQGYLLCPISLITHKFFPKFVAIFVVFPIYCGWREKPWQSLR
jgi:hypothetical protein